MSFLLNSFTFLSSGASFYYATSDGAGADIADTGGISGSGTFTIPSLWNARLVRLSASYRNEAGANVTLAINKGGGNVAGLPKSHVESNSTDEMLSVHSAPLVVATGETFTAATLVSGNGNAFGIQLLPSTLKYALVNRITSGFSVGTAFTPVQWNNEVADAQAAHDNTTNPSRLTYWSGGSGLIRLSASIELASAPGEVGITFYKNGSQISDIEMDTETSATNISAISQPLVATSGDYFEVAIRTGATVNVIVSNNSWFAIEDLDAALNWTGTTFSAVALTSSSYVSVASRTVPSGVTLIRAGFFGRKSSTTGTIAYRVQKGATEFTEGAGNEANSASSEFVHAFTVPFAVSPGDTISLYGYTNAGAQTGSGYFWIEEVPVVT